MAGHLIRLNSKVNFGFLTNFHVRTFLLIQVIFIFKSLYHMNLSSLFENILKVPLALICTYIADFLKSKPDILFFRNSMAFILLSKPI